MACDCLVQEQLLTTKVGTENILHNDVYLSWSLRSAAWCRRKEVFQVFTAVLPVNIYCVPGWTAVIHTSLMAAAPGNVGVPAEEGDSCLKPVLFRGSRILGVSSPP